MADYANPDVLVETQWVADHLDDPKARLIEIVPIDALSGNTGENQ